MSDCDANDFQQNAALLPVDLNESGKTPQYLGETPGTKVITWQEYREELMPNRLPWMP